MAERGLGQSASRHIDFRSLCGVVPKPSEWAKLLVRLSAYQVSRCSHRVEQLPPSHIPNWIEPPFQVCLDEEAVVYFLRGSSAGSM